MNKIEKMKELIVEVTDKLVPKLPPMVRPFAKTFLQCNVLHYLDEGDPDEVEKSIDDTISMIRTYLDKVSPSIDEGGVENE